MSNPKSGTIHGWRKALLIIGATICVLFIGAVVALKFFGLPLFNSIFGSLLSDVGRKSYSGQLDELNFSGEEKERLLEALLTRSRDFYGDGQEVSYAINASVLMHTEAGFLLWLKKFETVHIANSGLSAEEKLEAAKVIARFANTSAQSFEPTASAILAELREEVQTPSFKGTKFKKAYGDEEIRAALSKMDKISVGSSATPPVDYVEILRIISERSKSVQ